MKAWGTVHCLPRTALAIPGGGDHDLLASSSVRACDAFTLNPTVHRELAFQINEVFEALGASIGLKCCCIVGGIDMMTQVRSSPPSTPSRYTCTHDVCVRNTQSAAKGLGSLSFLDTFGTLTGPVCLSVCLSWLNTQAIALARKPHVVIATPGRLVDHLENTKGFNLRTVKYLILDEVGVHPCHLLWLR